MTEGGSTGAARPYNRPRRYPVPAPDAGPPADPPTSADVTRQNPTLAEAAQDQWRPVQGAAPQTPAPPYPHPVGNPAPPPAADGPSVAVSRRGLLVGLAVLLAIAAVGLVLGLSGGNGSTHPGTPSSAPAAPGGATPAGSAVLPTTPAPTTSVAPGGGASPAEVCTRLGVTAPFTAYVAQPRPTAQLPAGYLEPPAGTRVGLCLGRFRPGAGAGRGTLAYLVEYEQLPATQYAAALKTAGWAVAPALPQNTFRRLTTTVTLVPQGTALVVVVGTGR